MYKVIGIFNAKGFDSCKVKKMKINNINNYMYIVDWNGNWRSVICSGSYLITWLSKGYEHCRISYHGIDI